MSSVIASCAAAAHRLARLPPRRASERSLKGKCRRLCRKDESTASPSSRRLAKQQVCMYVCMYDVYRIYVRGILREQPAALIERESLRLHADDALRNTPAGLRVIVHTSGWCIGFRVNRSEAFLLYSVYMGKFRLVLPIE